MIRKNNGTDPKEPSKKIRTIRATDEEWELIKQVVEQLREKPVLPDKIKIESE